MVSPPPSFVMNRKRRFTATAGGRDRGLAMESRIEAPMFKPIVVEAFIILLAALGYLVERHHGAVKLAETATAAASTQAPEPHGPADPLRSRGELSGKPLDTTQPVRRIVAWSIPVVGTLSQDQRQPGSLQLLMDARGSDTAAIRQDRMLEFQAASLPGRRFTAQVVQIAPGTAVSVLQLRLSVPDSRHLLHPGLVVSGQLEAGERIAWVVPGSAVLRLGDTDYIIVRDGQRYRRMAVTGQWVEAGRYAITGGLIGVVPTVVSDVGQWLSLLAGEG